MTQAMISVGVFLVLFACLPLLIRWVQQRANGRSADVRGGSSRFISAVAVGTHQKIVTVEVGPEGARVWLTLGVAPNSITCLHTTAAPTTAAGESLSLESGGSHATLGR